jgi:hypothetical protein
LTIVVAVRRPGRLRAVEAASKSSANYCLASVRRTGAVVADADAGRLQYRVFTGSSVVSFGCRQGTVVGRTTDACNTYSDTEVSDSAVSNVFCEIKFLIDQAQADVPSTRSTCRQLFRYNEKQFRHIEPHLFLCIIMASSLSCSLPIDPVKLT